MIVHIPNYTYTYRFPTFFCDFRLFLPCTQIVSFIVNIYFLIMILKKTEWFVGKENVHSVSMSHCLASPPFVLFEPTFETKDPSEQPTKLLTLWFWCGFPTVLTHPVSFLDLDGFKMWNSFNIQNSPFGCLFEAIPFIHLSCISGWHTGQWWTLNK